MYHPPLIAAAMPATALPEIGTSDAGELAPEQLPDHHPASRFLAYWHKQRNAAGLLERDRFDPMAVAALLPWLMVIDAATIDHVMRFRVRLQGTGAVLAEGEKTVGEVERLLDLSQSALSQHLAHLRHAGLVRTRRNAQRIHYSLASKQAEAIIRIMRDVRAAPAAAGTGITGALSQPGQSHASSA